jgi:hypothetical protein
MWGSVVIVRPQKGSASKKSLENTALYSIIFIYGCVSTQNEMGRYMLKKLVSILAVARLTHLSNHVQIVLRTIKPPIRLIIYGISPGVTFRLATRVSIVLKLRIQGVLPEILHISSWRGACVKPPILHLPYALFFLWRAPQQTLWTHRSLEAYCATLW